MMIPGVKIRPKKFLSQNFLIDLNIARKIADSIETNESDCIIEIGCGTGSLTQFLLQKNSILIGTELDKSLISLLNDKFPKNNFPYFSILHKDILKVKLQELINSYELNEGFKFTIAGNIPYNISSEIYFWIFEQSENIKKATLMVQKEVAQRLTAKPRTKEYGIPTIAMELAGSCKILFDVSPDCFNPRPEVTSSVIQMIMDKETKFSENKNVFELVKAGFNQRRKTLRNALRNYLEKKLRFDKEKMSNFIEEYNEQFFSKRAEELSTEDFIKLESIIEKTK